MADQHALELRYFLDEARVTPTDLFAAMADNRYRSNLLSGVQAVVNDYKQKGRNPPPVVLNDDHPQQTPGTSKHAGPPSYKAASIQSNQGQRNLSSVPSAPLHPGPMANSAQYVDLTGSDGSSSSNSRNTVRPSVQPYTARQNRVNPQDLVPGTNIRIDTLTAPQAWLYLHPPTIDAPMSFLARIGEHKQTRHGDPVVMLDFGNSEGAVLFVDRDSREGLFYNMQYRYMVGSFVYVERVTKIQMGNSLYLHFGRHSSIKRLQGMTLDTVAQVNQKCNRLRQRSYAEVVDSTRGNSLSFVEDWSRRQRERRGGNPRK